MLLDSRRALRPLQIATRLDGLRTIVIAMVSTIPAVSEIALVAVLFYYIFAVLGVYILNGQFYGCYDAGNGALLDPYYLQPLDQTIDKYW